MTNNKAKLEALSIALDYAGLAYDDVNIVKVNLTGDMLGICYEIEFTTDSQRYYAYVDALDGEVSGYMTVPMDADVTVSAAA